VTRLSDAFGKGAALVCFITAGDGDTAANLDALVAGGADVVELGMPFTDPMADGPAIQKASARARRPPTYSVSPPISAPVIRRCHWSSWAMPTR